MADDYDFDDEEAFLPSGPLRSEGELIAGINSRSNDVRSFLTRLDKAEVIIQYWIQRSVD
jgi:hypothetical protein